MSACIIGRVDNSSTATFVLSFLISLTAPAESCLKAFGAEARANAKPATPLTTMSERVGPPAAFRGISLNLFAASRDSGSAVGLGSTTGAHVAGEPTTRSLDVSLATPRPVARGADLAAATNHRGFWGADQAKVQGALRGVQQGSGVAATASSMLKFGLSDAAERPKGSDASLWSRGRETNAFAANPTVAAIGGVHHAALFSAAAVIEPASQATPASSYSPLNFATESASDSLQSMGRPLENGSSLINLAR